MNAFHWFLVFVAVVWGSIIFLARGILKSLSSQAATHAKKYAAAYAKGAALVAMAAILSFSENFEKLSPDVASAYSWWAWLVLFFKPVAAAILAFITFMDQTVGRIKDADPNAPPTNENRH